MKKLKVISALLCCSLLLVGCGKGSNGNNSVKNDSKEKAPVELNISAAASLKEVMADLETEYKKYKENVETLLKNCYSKGKE